MTTEDPENRIQVSGRIILQVHKPGVIVGSSNDHFAFMYRHEIEDVVDYLKCWLETGKLVDMGPGER